METIYYRKIAELVHRDERHDAAVRSAAERALATGRETGDNIARKDRRLLKAWMRDWCYHMAAKQI